MITSQLQKAYELFDSYNKQDPRRVSWRASSYPLEYAYSLMLHEWVLLLEPEPSEELLLASRSQHIGRWEIPRDSYPEGRDAYLKWRKDLGQHHAEISAALMKQAGYSEQQICRVKDIILKKRFKVDAETQTMENALCLLFLAFQYEDFKNKHIDDPEKVINVLYKSLLKMDRKGIASAMLIEFTADGLTLLNKAITRLNEKKNEKEYGN